MNRRPIRRLAISAGIVTRDGAVLLVQRKVKEGSLSWQFPAGEAEPGKTLEQDELADLACVKPSEFASYVPHGFAPAVEKYLQTALT